MRQERSRHDVGHHERRVERLAALHLDAGRPPPGRADRDDPRARPHVAAELPQAPDERVREPPRAALRARPADRVPHEVEVCGGDRAARAARRHVPVHGRAVEPGPRARRVEQLLAQPLRRGEQQPHEVDHRAGPELRDHLRRPAQRREARQHRAPHGAEALDVGRRERPPALAVAGREPVEARGRLVQRAATSTAARPPGSGCA